MGDNVNPFVVFQMKRAAWKAAERSLMSAVRPDKVEACVRAYFKAEREMVEAKKAVIGR